MKYCASINKTAHFQLCGTFLGYKTTTIKTTNDTLSVLWWWQHLKFIQPLSPEVSPRKTVWGSSEIYSTTNHPAAPLTSLFSSGVSLTFTLSGWFSYYSLTEHCLLTVLPPQDQSFSRALKAVKGYDFALSLTSQATYRLPYLIGERSLKGIPAENTEGEIKGGQT